jgi:response regulator RpfG family c-di-GMP phosphodiesterase
MENNNVYHLNILLADDDKDDCLLFQDALKELTIATTFVAVYDGEQLMRHLLEKKNKPPTVLFLDLNMPRKNGFACLEEIKSNENIKQIPVIILSTSYDEKIANRLYKNGALHYIFKPIDFSDLTKIIEKGLLLISKGATSQPSRENFLLNNLKTIHL